MLRLSAMRPMVAALRMKSTQVMSLERAAAAAAAAAADAAAAAAAAAVVVAAMEAADPTSCRAVSDANVQHASLNEK